MDSTKLKRTHLLQKLEGLNKSIKSIERMLSQTGMSVIPEQLAEVYKWRADAEAELAALPPESDDVPPPPLDGYSTEELRSLIDSSLTIEDVDEAVRVADELIRRDQSDENRFKAANAYYKRGMYFYGFQKYELALKDFDAALSLKPDYSAVFVAKGDYFDSQYDYGQALEEWNKALEIAQGEEFLAALARRGMLYKKLGSHKYQVEKYSALVRPDPNVYDAFAGQNVSWQTLYQLALTDLDKVLYENPASHFYQLRAEIHLDLEEYEKALKDCNEAIRLGGGNPGDYVLRIKIYKATGNTEAAAADEEIVQRYLSSQQQNFTKAFMYTNIIRK